MHYLIGSLIGVVVASIIFTAIICNSVNKNGGNIETLKNDHEYIVNELKELKNGIMDNGDKLDFIVNSIKGKKTDF